jgi:AcrR family transcriptional regulator
MVNGCRVKYVTPPSLPAGSDNPEGRLTREERRRRTEATILEAAQRLFAEVGFEKTTIRGVAAQAGIDPALVMQYFGSKEGLFAASARAFADRKRALDAPRDALAAAALQDLFTGFEDPGQAAASIAVLRNCLTHERALAVMRDQVMSERHAKLAETIGGPDADLRAGLLASIMIGTTIARYLIEIPAVAGAGREDLERVLGPVLNALVEPAD